MHNALDELIVIGIKTNSALPASYPDDAFRRAEINIHYLEHLIRRD